MRRRSQASIAAAFILGLGCLFAQPVDARTNYVEGEVLVRFRDSAGSMAPYQIADRHSVRLVRHFRHQFRGRHRSYGLFRSLDRTTADLVADFKHDPDVEIVEPNHLRYSCDLRTPNDPLFQQLWGLENTGQVVNGFAGMPQADIAFRSAWGMARPSTNPAVVAVLDTGVDYTHPDLATSMWTNPGEIPGNLVDDDGNGYVDDIHGYDFADGNEDPMDSGIHGTHVAGIVSASGNNNIGIIGVAFQTRIMALKASSDGDQFPSSAILEAIQYATLMKQAGVNIVAINASFVGSGFSLLERNAIEDSGDEGIAFCAAAGNETNNNDSIPHYPASYSLDNIIAVAATDQDDELADFSNYGATTVDIAAPGVNIVSAFPVSLVGFSGYVQQSSNIFAATGLEFAGTTAGITATLHDCGLGYPSNFPPAVEGNIALIERGTLYFSEKVTNAMSAGAVAAVIYNNTNGNFFGTLQSPGDWIPAVSISQEDGQALLPLLPATATVVNELTLETAYQLLDGTSMATPHVAGAVAFAAMNFPAETVNQRIQRILSNASPRSNLLGLVGTGSRLNLARTVDTDENGLPDWWEQIYFNQLTGTDPDDDPDQDKRSNVEEWLSGTNPTNENSVLRFAAITRPGSNSTMLQWPSVQGRHYRLLGETDPLTGFSLIIRTNIAATPPLNTENDTNADASAQFYLLQLEP